MRSLAFLLTKDDFINSDWQDVANSSERKECSIYSRDFWNKAQAAKAAGNIRQQAVLEILAVVTSPAVKPGSTDEFFADLFQHLTDEHLDFLTEIVSEVSDPELQARIADILWVRRHDYRMAQLAVTAYLQSAIELEYPQNWSSCFHRIERALRLARKINHQIDEVVNHIETVLNRYNEEDPFLLSTKLMQLLQEFQLGDPKKYAAIAQKAATIAELARDWHRARDLWTIKAIWHRRDKDEEKERAASMLAAETYIKEAEDAFHHHPVPYLAASSYLQKAVEAFRSIRGTNGETLDAKARGKEAHKLMIQYQAQSIEELGVISTEVDISNEVDKARNFVKGKKLQDALFCLALLGASPRVSKLRQLAQETELLSRFAPIVKINEIGKVVARQSSNTEEIETAFKLEMYITAIDYQRCHVQAFIEPARDRINLEHSVQISDFLPIVSNNPFIPSNREYLFAKGLYAGLTGDFITSTHILIPQIENSVRYLLAKQGVITSGLDRGIQKEHFLTSTLYPTNYPEIATIFDEDTLFDLQGLLVEHSGSNLRNRMAHGLIDDREFGEPIMCYLWWLTLRLCCLPILNYQQIVAQSDPWVSFAGMFKDDPLFDEFVEDMAAYRRELDAETTTCDLSSEEQQSG
jgi:hypothetical protein